MKGSRQGRTSRAGQGGAVSFGPCWTSGNLHVTCETKLIGLADICGERRRKAGLAYNSRSGRDRVGRG